MRWVLQKSNLTGSCFPHHRIIFCTVIIIKAKRQPTKLTKVIQIISMYICIYLQCFSSSSKKYDKYEMIRNWYDILPKEDFLHVLWYQYTWYSFNRDKWIMGINTKNYNNIKNCVLYIFIFCAMKSSSISCCVSELSIISNAQTSHYHHPSSSFWTREQLSLHCICICIRQAAAFQVTHRATLHYAHLLRTYQVGSVF